MQRLSKGRYTVRCAENAEDAATALQLRSVCFGAIGGIADRFDATSTQILVIEENSQIAVATFRLAVLDGGCINDSYAAQYYDLSALDAFEGPMLEVGRFCIHPTHKDPDILRAAWAALTAYVDEMGVEMLFGCSSFAGTDVAPYLDAFALLQARHLSPVHWAPRVKAQDVFTFGAEPKTKLDLKRANAAMPPLLRTYLMMGGWVSDHAVVDHEMNTLHVFTGLEIKAIPEARKRLLRALV